MPSAVIMKIISLQSNFTASENEISQFVIKNPDFVITNTITILAKEINTSEASINRFCKKVGYKGFNSFKISLAQSNFQEDHLNEEAELDGANTLDALSADYRKMITNTCTMLDNEALEEAASMITLSRKIHLFAFYTTSFISDEFAFKLRQIGLDASVHTENLEIQLTIANMNSDSLIIAIVSSVISKGIIPLLSSAKAKGVKIILISGNDSTKIEDVVDLKLITPDTVLSSHPLIISNSLIYAFVTDALYAIILRDNKALRQRKLNSNTIIDSFQSIESTL